jgi:hypothetical protein
MTAWGGKKSQKRAGDGCCLGANFIHIQGGLVETLREKSQVLSPRQCGAVLDESGGLGTAGDQYCTL